MTPPLPADDVPRLLLGSQDGQVEARDKLFAQIYDELRDRARWQRRRWRGDPTLQTTALVNEAYLKLVNQDRQSWSSRSHFFAVAAKAMRHILVDWARRKHAEKRGGGVPKLSVEAVRERVGRDEAATNDTADLLVLLDEALAQLEQEHPRAARGVEYRFFGGMTIEETAEALRVSTATVSRDWKLAHAWLYREVKGIIETAATPGDH